jgi:hypothetical protein
MVRVQFLTETRSLLFTTMPRIPQSPKKWIPETHFLELKQLEDEANYSSPLPYLPSEVGAYAQE